MTGIHRNFPSREIAPDLCSRLNWLARYFPDETEAMIQEGNITKVMFSRLRRGNVSRILLGDIAVIAAAYGVSIEWLVYGQGEPRFDWHDQDGLPIEPRQIEQEAIHQSA